MFELEISIWLRWRSFFMVIGNKGGTAYHDQKAITVKIEVSFHILNHSKSVGRTY